MEKLIVAPQVEPADATDQMLRDIWTALTSLKPPDTEEMMRRHGDREKFGAILSILTDLRELSGALGKGDLSRQVYGKGYVLSGLKALQSNLRHLTWQTQKIAEGDFSLSVDFLGEFSASFNEMTRKLAEYSESLKHLAHIDPLTQVPNRLFLGEFLSKCFARFHRGHEPFSVAMFDLDHFKRINDTYGHDAGDKVLVQVSQILSSQFRSCDLFARYGGEEFIAVLIDIGGDKLYEIVTRARKAVDSALCDIGNDERIRLTVSIGASEAALDDADCDAVVKRGDEALYEAKRAGRNRVWIV